MLIGRHLYIPAQQGLKHGLKTPLIIFRYNFARFVVYFATGGCPRLMYRRDNE